MALNDFSKLSDAQVPGGLHRACEWRDKRIAKLDAKAAS